MREGYEQFEVQGAGEICFSNDPHSITGTVAGFSVYVTWNDKKFGCAGGVLGRSEAKRLAEFILEKIEGITESEADEIERRRKELMEKFK